MTISLDQVHKCADIKISHTWFEEDIISPVLVYVPVITVTL